MQVNLKGILEGAWNSVFIRESVEKIAGQRMEICNGCSLSSDNQKKFNGYKTFRPDVHCTNCGCNLHMKTRCMSENCPIGKWLACMSSEEENEMNKKLQEDGKDTS